MRKWLLQLLADLTAALQPDSDELPEAFASAMQIHANRLGDLERRVGDLEVVTVDKAEKSQVRKRIVTRTMSDYRQAMGEEEIHVP